MAIAISPDRSADRSGDVFPAGKLLAGRFRVEVVLGSGGMATVYRAKDLATSKPVALKVLRRELSTVPEAATRFRREGELLQGFVHPGIVRVETFGALEDGTLFLAMELLEGETLGQMMRRRGALDPDDVAPILTGACAPLAAAHAKGIVHRDLKPDNVFLVRAPGASEADFTVKLLDFGISKVFGSERLTQTGELLGTPRYMAPEQLAADHDLDGRVDVYALGVILYETLAARPPFLGATPSDLIVAILNGKMTPLGAVRADLPPEIESVVMRTMSRAREARYPTPEALANAFVSALGQANAGRAAVPARPGMETAVLGSMQSAPAAHGLPAKNQRPPIATLVNSPALDGQVAGAGPRAAAEPLVPGTLSGFAPTVLPVDRSAPALAPAREPAPEPRERRSAGAANGGSERRAGRVQFAAPVVPALTPASPDRDGGPREQGDQPAQSSRAGEGSLASGTNTTGRLEAVPDDFELPTRFRGRTLLIICVALLAGAISMGIAIFVLSRMNRRSAPAVTAPLAPAQSVATNPTPSPFGGTAEGAAPSAQAPVVAPIDNAQLVPPGAAPPTPAATTDEPSVGVLPRAPHTDT